MSSMIWVQALLLAVPLELLVWGVMDRESPRSAKAFWEWWGRDGMMVFIVIIMFLVIWLGRNTPPEPGDIERYPDPF